MSSLSKELSTIEVFPELVVFDLDQCLWRPEMYTLDEIPTRTSAGPLGPHGEGATGAWSGRQKISLFPAALEVLQDFYLNKYPSTMRIAAASSADTPHAVRIGRAAMDLLEIVPGVTMREVFAKGWEAEKAPGFDGNMQIGRSPPLTSDKATSHFPRIRQETGVPYDRMLFFDDCNWGDHCGKVERQCPGVVTQRTPDGLQYSEWLSGLRAYSDRYS